MKLMSGSGDKAAAPDAPSPDAEPGPIGAAMTTPQLNEGAQAEAQAKVALGMKMLSMALPPYGSESKEGSALMDAISKLQKAFGIRLDEGASMIPAELKMLFEAAGEQTPEMQAAMAPPAAAPAPMPMAA